MALDWKQEVSLSTITDLVRSKGKGGGGGSSAYPTKATMNLYQGDAKERDIKKTVMVGVLLAIAIALFTKFGVLDRLALVSQKEGELAQAQQTLSAVKSSASEYADLKEEYDAYAVSYGSGSIDPAIVFSLVEQQVMPLATVTNIQVADGELTLTLDNASLDTAGTIANNIKTLEVVKSVNVSTASNQSQSSGGAKVTTTIVVKFATAAAKED